MHCSHFPSFVHSTNAEWCIAGVGGGVEKPCSGGSQGLAGETRDTLVLSEPRNKGWSNHRRWVGYSSGKAVDPNQTDLSLKLNVTTKCVALGKCSSSVKMCLIFLIWGNNIYFSWSVTAITWQHIRKF